MEYHQKKIKPFDPSLAYFESNSTYITYPFQCCIGKANVPKS